MQATDDSEKLARCAAVAERVKVEPFSMMRDDGTWASRWEARLSFATEDAALAFARAAEALRYARG